MKAKGVIILNLDDKGIEYFLGANSPDGFFSYFDYLTDKKNISAFYIIKGGPGTGKSSFMRKIAQRLKEEGKKVILIPCSSDPYSLDAIVCSEIGIAFVDGTAPHTIDPKYPGAVDTIINLGDMWNTQTLIQHKNKIISLTDRIKASYENAYRYLSVVRRLGDDIINATHPHLQAKRLSALYQRIVKKELPKSNIGKESRITKCFLSAISYIGITSLFDRLEKENYKIYRLSDDYYISPYLTEKISVSAYHLGLDIMPCYCPLSPDSHPQHLIIPELKLAFITSNDVHPYTGEFFRNISLNRYIDSEPLRSRRARIRFDSKAMDSMLEESISCLKAAKNLHDELEEIYIAAMDFKKVDEFCDKLLKELI